MNKRLIGLIVALFLTVMLVAQDLDAFNEERLQINKRGMTVLGSWALVNVVSSPIMASRVTGSTKYFHQMNGYWNSVNLLIAGFGYYSSVKAKSEGLSLSETMKQQQNIEKILLLNTGLDVAYMTAGMFLNERGKNNSSDRLQGFGKSLILQGGFLFVFDLAFYLFHNKHADQLSGIMDKLTITPSGIGIIWKL